MSDQTSTKAAEVMQSARAAATKYRIALQSLTPTTDDYGRHPKGDKLLIDAFAEAIAQAEARGEQRATKSNAVMLLRNLVADLETFTPDMLDELRETPEAADMRVWLSTQPEGIVLDLDHEAMRMLCEAAAQSSWIPHEHYIMNDWLADCCEFLRTGKGAQPAPSGDVVGVVARAIEIAVVESTMHHPIRRYLTKLSWLWPKASQAALAAARPIIERETVERMLEPTEAMLDASWKLTGESKEMRPRTHAHYRRHYEAMVRTLLNGKDAQ